MTYMSYYFLIYFSRYNIPYLPTLKEFIQINN